MQFSTSVYLDSDEVNKDAKVRKAALEGHQTVDSKTLTSLDSVQFGEERMIDFDAITFAYTRANEASL